MCLCSVILKGKPSKSDFPEGLHKMSYTVFDRAGNKGSCRFTVRVRGEPSKAESESCIFCAEQDFWLHFVSVSARHISCTGAHRCDTLTCSTHLKTNSPPMASPHLNLDDCNDSLPGSPRGPISVIQRVSVYIST